MITKRNLQEQLVTVEKEINSAISNLFDYIINCNEKLCERINVLTDDQKNIAAEFEQEINQLQGRQKIIDSNIKSLFIQLVEKLQTTIGEVECEKVEQGKSYCDTHERLVHIEDKINILIDNLQITMNAIENEKEEREKNLYDMHERLVHIEDKVNQLKKAGYEVASRKIIYKNDYESDRKQYDFGIWGMWFTQNYGAALTSYAIAKEIEDMGYSIVQIDLPRIGGESNSCNTDNPDRVFINEHFETTEMLEVKDIDALNDVCDNFVVPSDSLWGGGYGYQMYDLRACLFGEFLNMNKKIVSFSTSFGTWQPSEKDSIERRYMASLMKKFTHISMREKSGVEICKKYYGIDANWTLDPVWLLDRKNYDELINIELDIPEKYIFAYVLKPLSDKMEMLKYISERVGMQVIFVPDMNEDHLAYIDNDFRNYDFIYKEKISVPDWLTYLKKAGLVVTDSYHGMVFSMIYEKQFLELYPRDGLVRFTDLAEYLDLKRRVNLKNKDEIEDALREDICYSSLNKRISEKIIHDKAELKQCIQITYEMNRNTIGNMDVDQQMMYLRIARELKQ